MNRGEFGRRARQSLANLLRQQMVADEFTMDQVAKKANVQLIVVQRLLDCVPNPTRPEIMRIIGVIGFSKLNRKSAEKYLNTFSPSKPSRGKQY
jgi:hypothetical protein